jgi:hypothetical protein
MSTWHFLNNSGHTCKCVIQGRTNGNSWIIQPGQWLEIEFSEGYKTVMTYNWQSPDNPWNCKVECCYPVKVYPGQEKWCGLYMHFHHWDTQLSHWWCQKPEQPRDPCEWPCGGSNDSDTVINGGIIN